ncbi:putative serine-rich protein [Aspergillus campestris IBT 28561]|uniref:Serine-rich protein n=1 Tax=Aspergillus campestris (strain IBT 28561) TaxID=1392248 RepID=A0A2I1DAF3_ASPC2|nr:putative serine-rich protein [Aspergillus campestris IBT 28561]PKY06867.1 putative serine-rich protein [Aspergillus campestris IBT 28561]
MRSSGSSRNSSPKRRALHERTPSHTNESSPPTSLRAASDKVHHRDNDQGEGDEERGVYTSNPYPTKPEHVLLPRPGKGHEFVPDARFHVDEAPHESSRTVSTDVSQGPDSSLVRSISDPWDLSSTFDAENTPSQVWEDDPKSSKSTFPDPDSELSESKPREHGSDQGSIAAYSDDEPNTLPAAAPTIKTVISEPSSRQASMREHANSSHSSPNVRPIGPPSSPNFVELDNSSLNFVRLGASSNPDTGSRSNSLSSLNSLGTVIRYAGAAQWTHGSSSGSSSKSRSRSRSHSIRSHRHYPSIPSVRSMSTQPRERSHSGSATESSRSGPPSDIQAIVDSGVFIQYPSIREPSSSSSRVDVSLSADSEHTPDFPSDQSSERFKSHLSTVSSRWSAEYDSRGPSPADEPTQNTLEEPSRPPAALARQRPASSSMWLVDASGCDESMDNISNLPTRPTNPAVPNSLSSGSRQSSVRSNKRPGTASSIAYHILPNWARMYYQMEGQAENSALSVVEAHHAPEARPKSTHAHPLSRMETTISRPRTGTNASRQSVRWHPDPRDPRSHWVKGMDPEGRPGTSRDRLRSSWSAHLYPDRRAVQHRANAWTAPSMDSRSEPLLGRRNIQVWSFSVGFIFPIAWLVAAFLPLPRKPEMILEEDTDSELESTLRMRLFDVERRRYENARWWRNLNRWMNPLGLVILTIVITLAVVGTTVGF